MRDYPLLFAAAPWFCDLAVRDVVNIERDFTDGAGMLPGPLPLQAMYFYYWRALIAVPPSILRETPFQGRTKLPPRFMDTVLDRL